MALILMIAAGILLAMILLPLLSPIAMIAVCIAVIALLGCSIIFSIGVGMAAVDAAKEMTAKTKNQKRDPAASCRRVILSCPRFFSASPSKKDLTHFHALSPSLLIFCTFWRGKSNAVIIPPKTDRKSEKNEQFFDWRCKEICRKCGDSCDLRSEMRISE